MQGKLEQALEKIEAFNAEEEAYGWETSQYPLRNEVASNLVPFAKLYETCADFVVSHDQWVNGDMSKAQLQHIQFNHYSSQCYFTKTLIVFDGAKESAIFAKHV